MNNTWPWATGTVDLGYVLGFERLSIIIFQSPCINNIHYIGGGGYAIQLRWLTHYEKYKEDDIDLMALNLHAHTMILGNHFFQGTITLNRRKWATGGSS